jgi:ribonuclease HI
MVYYFHMNQRGCVVYTDGASKGNPGPGGWGVIVAAKEKVSELGGKELLTTNNRMELMAAIKALQFLAGTSGVVTIYIDSGYVVKGVTQWISAWRKRGWVTMNKQPVLNQDLWEALSTALDELSKTASVTWKQIRGHSGVPGNERVDEIATAFAEGKIPELFHGPRDQYTINVIFSEADASASYARSAKKSTSTKKPYSYISMVDGAIKTHATWKECEARVKGKSGARR